MPPKPDKAPQKVVRGGKDIKITDKSSDQDNDSNYSSSDSENNNEIQKEKSPRKSIEKEIVKRNCFKCRNRGLSPNTCSSHIASNRNYPSKDESIVVPQVVSSKKPNISEITKVNKKNEQIKILGKEEKEKELRQICEKEKSVGLKVVNSLLFKRSKEEEREKLSLPTIPKRKPPLDEDIFYNSPVKVIVPDKRKEKALTLLKSKRAKLMKNCQKETTNEDSRGVHYREVGPLLRIRALSNDCISLIPRTGCRTIAQRAEFWSKLEMIQECLQQTIRFAGQWDNENQLEGSSNT